MARVLRPRSTVLPSHGVAHGGVHAHHVSGQNHLSRREDRGGGFRWISVDFNEPWDDGWAMGLYGFTWLWMRLTWIWVDVDENAKSSEIMLKSVFST